MFNFDKQQRGGTTSSKGKTRVARHIARWAALLAIAMLMGACVWEHDHHRGPRRAAVTGRVTAHVGGYKFPIYEGRVALNYSQGGSTLTDRNGRYTYSGLLEGSHAVSLYTLHGAYGDTVYIRPDRGTHRLNWNLYPKGLESGLFFELAGLRRVWVDGRGEYHYADDGELVRWEKPTVSVYFDVDGAPSGFRSGWVNEYMQELDRWTAILDSRVSVRRSYDPKADIVVKWVPEGSLRDGSGLQQLAVARHVAFFRNGALQKVEIDIDVAYGMYRGIWNHEFAHAMGVGHVRNQNSVMDPVVRSHQPTTLTNREIAHVRLMYDIPSGVTLGRGGTYGTVTPSALSEMLDRLPFDVATEGGAIVGDPDDGETQFFAASEVEISSESGRREHVLLLDPNF